MDGLQWLFFMILSGLTHGLVSESNKKRPIGYTGLGWESDLRWLNGISFEIFEILLENKI